MSNNTMENKFARGRSSEVFKLEDGKVLKLFFEEYPKADAEREYKNTKIAYECGCTPMQCYEMIEQDGRTGLIMDFVDGVSQNDMPTKNPLYILKGGTDLAEIHAVVHSASSHELVDVRKMAIEILDTDVMNILTDEEREKAKKYIESLPEDDTIIHLDFHTGNVLVDSDGKCTVIDWMTAARGNRAVEVGMMQFLFADAELFPGSSKLMLAFYSAVRGMIGRQYFKRYQEILPISEEEIRKYKIIPLIIRRSWDIEFEKETLTKQMKELISEF